MNIRESSIIMVLSTWIPPRDVSYSFCATVIGDGPADVAVMLRYKTGVMEIDIDAKNLELCDIHPRLRRYIRQLINRVDHPKIRTRKSPYRTEPGRN